MSADGTPGPGETPGVEIARGAPTEEDLAAIAAVLPTAYVEETVTATADEPPARDAWNRSMRLRRPIDRGEWGRFAG